MTLPPRKKPPSIGITVVETVLADLFAPLADRRKTRLLKEFRTLKAAEVNDWVRWFAVAEKKEINLAGAAAEDTARTVERLLTTEKMRNPNLIRDRKRKEVIAEFKKQFGMSKRGRNSIKRIYS